MVFPNEHTYFQVNHSLFKLAFARTKSVRRSLGKENARGTTFYPDQVEDYWALLLEKAFAKFVGGYMNLEGGCPRWAVTYLSGGITTHDEITESFSVQNAVSTTL